MPLNASIFPMLRAKLARCSTARLASRAPSAVRALLHPWRTCTARRIAESLTALGIAVALISPGFARARASSPPTRSPPTSPTCGRRRRAAPPGRAPAILIGHSPAAVLAVAGEVPEAR